MSTQTARPNNSFTAMLRREQIVPGLPYYLYDIPNGRLFSGYFLSGPHSRGRAQHLAVVKEGRLRGNRIDPLARKTRFLPAIGVATREFPHNRQSLIVSPSFPEQIDAFLEWIEEQAKTGDMHALMWDVIIRPLWELEAEVDTLLSDQSDTPENNPWDGIHDDLL